MTAPAPTQLTSPLSPSAVVQTAVATLAARGFTVTTSDATNGIVVAQRVVEEGSAKDWLACRWGPNAGAWMTTKGGVTVTVLAKPAPSGSAVTITGTAHSTTHFGPYTANEGGEACASNGATEAAIAKAIR